MPKVRWRGPDVYRPHSSERGYFSPPSADDPPRSQTRSYPHADGAHYDRRYAVCIHEAAHAVTAVVRAQPLYEVLVDDDDESGVCRAYPASPGASSDSSTKINYHGLCEGMSAKEYPWAFEHCISYMAGSMAQSRVDPCADRVRDGARSDHERAQILAEAVTSSDDGAQDMLREAKREAETIIEDDWHRIERVARALYQRGRLDEDEVRAAMFGSGVRDDRRPYLDRGPEALGLTASHVAAAQERAGSPHDAYLWERRIRFLDARGY